jgi:hypothetical protein
MKLFFTQKLLAFSFFLCFKTAPITAQLRTIGGYNYSVANYSALNGIIEDYNLTERNIATPMKTFSGLHGINLGAQYRFGFYWVEFMWLNRFGKVSDRIRVSPNNSSDFSNTLRFRNQAFCLGSAVYYQWFAIGGSMDWNATKIRHERSYDGISDVLIDDGNFSLHLFANFELPPIAQGLTVNVRPYLHWAASPLGFQSVARKLMPTTAPNLRVNYNQRIVNFGISLSIAHGATCR